MSKSTLEERVDNIEARNKRVELDKKWETSWTRKILIAVLTYVVVVTYSVLIKKTSSVFLSSLVPVMGFVLSTLSLRLARRVWEKVIL
ncbi:MAG: hypothetical protein E7160_04335 [Firmicutes bacterium]|nr:hypothetical protein [Bacillota bacterium]